MRYCGDIMIALNNCTPSCSFIKAIIPVWCANVAPNHRYRLSESVYFIIVTLVIVYSVYLGTAISTNALMTKVHILFLNTASNFLCAVKNIYLFIETVVILINLCT